MRFTLRRKPKATLVLRRLVDPVDDGTEVCMALYRGDDRKEIKGVIREERVCGHKTVTLDMT